MFYSILIDVNLITISTIINIYFDMEWNLQLLLSIALHLKVTEKWNNLHV
jgi:hypothetical protein